MKTKHLLLLVFIAVVSLYACDEKEELDRLGESINLRIGESVDISDDLSITFDRISEDSRCPEGVACVWEGQARANLSINGTESVELIMRAGREELAKDTLNDLIYCLLDVSPYPNIEGPTPIPSEEYIIEFRVDKL